MPAPQVQSFTLTPHPATPSQAVRGIDGHVSRTPGGLWVNYVLKGDLDQMRVPKPRAPRFVDDLWRHSCFEMFIAGKGQPGYHEFNFSPSGEWAVYAFARLRERVPLDVAVTVEALNPHVTVCRGLEKLELDAVLPLERLSPRYAGARLALALSGVVEDRDGVLSYWALKHPRAKPDFHHPEAFVLELDEIRN